MTIKSENIKTLTLDLENQDSSENDNSISQLSKILSKESKSLHIHINLKNEHKSNIIEKLEKIEGLNIIAEEANKIILSKKNNKSNPQDTNIIMEDTTKIKEVIVEKEVIIERIQPTKIDLFSIIEKKAIRSGHILEITNSFKVLQENINNGGVLNIENGFVFLTKNNKGKIILSENSGLLFQKSHYFGVIEFNNVLITETVEDLVKYSDDKSNFLYLFVEEEQLKYDFI